MTLSRLSAYEDSGDEPTRPPDVLDLIEYEFGHDLTSASVRMFFGTFFVASEAQADLRSFDLGFEIGARCALRSPEALEALTRMTSYGRQCADNLETDLKINQAVELITGRRDIDVAS